MIGPEETAKSLMLVIDATRLVGSSTLVVVREPDDDMVTLAAAILANTPGAWFAGHALMLVVGERGALVFGIQPPAELVPFDMEHARRAGHVLAALARMRVRERPTA